MCRSLFFNRSVFLLKIVAQLFSYEFREFSGRLLLNVAIMCQHSHKKRTRRIRFLWLWCQEHFKLNVKTMRATIFGSLTSTFLWPQLKRDEIVTFQFIKPHVRIKLSHIMAYYIYMAISAYDLLYYIPPNLFYIQ